MTLIVNMKYTEGSQGFDESVNVTDLALEPVRFKFNPSGLVAVNRLKALSSAFIAECQAQQAANPAAAREFAVAITNMQTASMWAVLAATKGL